MNKRIIKETLTATPVELILCCIRQFFQSEFSDRFHRYTYTGAYVDGNSKGAKQSQKLIQ
jgi:hypothetical protein